MHPAAVPGEARGWGRREQDGLRALGVTSPRLQLRKQGRAGATRPFRAVWVRAAPSEGQTERKPDGGAKAGRAASAGEAYSPELPRKEGTTPPQILHNQSIPLDWHRPRHYSRFRGSYSDLAATGVRWGRGRLPFALLTPFLLVPKQYSPLILARGQDASQREPTPGNGLSAVRPPGLLPRCAQACCSSLDARQGAHVHCAASSDRGRGGVEARELPHRALPLAAILWSLFLFPRTKLAAAENDLNPLLAEVAAQFCQRSPHLLDLPFP